MGESILHICISKLIEGDISTSIRQSLDPGDILFYEMIRYYSDADGTSLPISAKPGANTSQNDYSIIVLNALND